MTACYKCPGYDSPACCMALAVKAKEVAEQSTADTFERRFVVVDSPGPIGNRKERRAAYAKARARK